MNAEESIRQQRLDKLDERARAGETVYPNCFKRNTTASILNDRFKDASAEALEGNEERFSLAGRIMTVRDFGKSCFMHLEDETGRLQLYVQKNMIGPDAYQAFKKLLDIGDIIGAEGTLFITRTGELTLKVEACDVLAKALRPLPEKFHGLRDVEMRYRKRYLDLLVNESVRSTFRTRARIIRSIRNFFDARGYLEVETPMMHALAGGAAARPFKTHHNALDIDLYLRIAPELYLKRLLVGGLGRVYEINKNFRNEGLSTHHNPEFTMIEFYEAYADYRDLMTLTEELFAGLLAEVVGGTRLTYQGEEIDFTPPWRKLSLEESLVEVAGVTQEEMADEAALRRRAEKMGLELPAAMVRGEILLELFEQTVEERLIQPTFVTKYPVEVSPLARSNEENPSHVDRFELFIAGREIANGFSELNDPREQRKRFLQQVEKRQRGDDTAQVMDEDYVEALEFGMPPAAGEGIGIDRLVMLLTDSASIRDVVLFPQMRPEKGQDGD